MSQFYKTFLTEDIRKLRASGGRSIALAAFGKHPGWDDHIEDEDFRLETETLVMVKQLLYVKGIGGQIDSGAWTKLTVEERLDKFGHLFLWSRGDQLVLGCLWASSDGKGRTSYPMIVCAHCLGLPLPWVLANVLPVLADLQQQCIATKSPADVKASFRSAQEKLRTQLAGFTGTSHDWRVSQAERQQFLDSPVFGAAHEGLWRILYQIKSRMSAYIADKSSRPKTVTADVMPQQMRVPACGPAPADSLRLWTWFLQTQIQPTTTLLLLLPLEQRWLDVVVGEPSSHEFFGLKASAVALALTNDIPYTLDPEFRLAASDLIDALKTPEGGNVASGTVAAIPSKLTAATLKERPYGGGGVRKLLPLAGIVVVALAGVWVWLHNREANKTEQPVSVARPTIEAAPSTMTTPTSADATAAVPQTVAASTAATTESPPSVAMGVVVLKSDPPGAEVLLDGASLGRIQTFSTNLAEGSYSFTATYPGLAQQSTNVVVTPGQEQQQVVTLRFPYGRVHLTSQPSGADVLRDGQKIGSTPYDSDALAPGQVDFVVAMGQRRREVGLEVRIDETVTNDVVLPESTGTLAVQSDPPGAEVFLGGASVGHAPVTTNLAAGTYEVSARDPDLGEQKEQLEVKTDERTEHTFEFPYGSVYLTSDPSGARVYVGDQLLGTTPYASNHVAIGQVKYELKTDTLVSNVTVTVESHKDWTNDVVFQVLVAPTAPMAPGPAAVMAPAGLKTLTNSIEMVLVWVPGVPNTSKDNGCWVGQYEVTQEEFEKVMGGADPSPTKKARLPVENVSLEDAQKFCQKLTEMDKLADAHYTLPTKEQWESLWGDAKWDDRDAVKSGPGTADQRKEPLPVGLRRPNQYGLYDIAGNVWEWCLDPADHTAVRKGGGYNTPPTLGLQPITKSTVRPAQTTESLPTGFRCIRVESAGNQPLEGQTP